MQSSHRYTTAVVRRIEEVRPPWWHHHPRQRQREPQEGEVISVGKGKSNDEARCFPGRKRGDRILFGKYSGTESADGEDSSSCAKRKSWAS